MISTIHANGARQGLTALVSTAVMAGPNVGADQVRSVFSSIVDLVVHTAKEPSAATADGRGGRRQVMEIVAIPPMQAADDEITVEPIFVRDDFGSPLRVGGRRSWPSTGSRSCRDSHRSAPVRGCCCRRSSVGWFVDRGRSWWGVAAALVGCVLLAGCSSDPRVEARSNFERGVEIADGIEQGLDLADRRVTEIMEVDEVGIFGGGHSVVEEPRVFRSGVLAVGVDESVLIVHEAAVSSGLVLDTRCDTVLAGGRRNAWYVTSDDWTVSLSVRADGVERTTVGVSVRVPLAGEESDDSSSVGGRGAFECWPVGER